MENLSSIEGVKFYHTLSNWHSLTNAWYLVSMHIVHAIESKRHETFGMNDKSSRTDV